MWNPYKIIKHSIAVYKADDVSNTHHLVELYKQFVCADVVDQIFTSSNFWRNVFKYETSLLSEACIHAIIYQQLRLIGCWYVSCLLGLKESAESNYKTVFKLIREAHRLGKKIKSKLNEFTYKEVVQLDVEETRRKYNIEFPIEFFKYLRENPKRENYGCRYTYPMSILRLDAEEI